MRAVVFDEVGVLPQVREVGPGVTRWRAGARVTTPFVAGCSICAVCTAGDPQVCPQPAGPGAGAR